jgi:hypothetical protein
MLWGEPALRLHLSQPYKRIIFYRFLGITSGLIAGQLLGLNPGANFVINFLIEGMHTFLHWCIEKRCPDNPVKKEKLITWVGEDDDALSVLKVEDTEVYVLGCCVKCQCCGRISIFLNRETAGWSRRLIVHEMGHAVLFKLMGFYSEKTPFHQLWDKMWGCLPSA